MPFSNNRKGRSGKPNRVKRTDSGDKFLTNRGKNERPNKEKDPWDSGYSKNSSDEHSKRSFAKNREPRKGPGKFGNAKYGENAARSTPNDTKDKRYPKSFSDHPSKRYSPVNRKAKDGERLDDRKRKENEERRPFNKNFGTRDKPSNAFGRGGEHRDGIRQDRERKVDRVDWKRNTDSKIRLNRYIANSGVCSRRKADELIEAGVVSVNGEVVTTLGTKVDPAKDEVRYNGERLKREKMVYVLLNKPKDYITTTDDPQERRTVMQLVEKASRERIYPVGRLDRNTTGLLLLTNDGDLADRLSHPKNNITKIYHVELSKNLTQGDFNKIEFGLELEDGIIKPDSISYVQGGSKREIGIQIHSGKNRIVRRIFEHLGYDVIKLDRVIYANLTKKDLPRGRWRYLEEKEIIQLKHFIK